jgi:hypothetical protein
MMKIDKIKERCELFEKLATTTLKGWILGGRFIIIIGNNYNLQSTCTSCSWMNHDKKISFLVPTFVLHFIIKKIKIVPHIVCECLMWILKCTFAKPLQIVESNFWFVIIIYLFCSLGKVLTFYSLLLALTEPSYEELKWTVDA